MKIPIKLLGFKGYCTSGISTYYSCHCTIMPLRGPKIHLKTLKGIFKTS